MIRRNYMITTRQELLLKKEAQLKQVSMSEILRKAIDAYFGQKALPKCP